MKKVFGITRSLQFRKILHCPEMDREVCAASSRNAHAEFIANVFSLSTMRRINRSTDSGNDAGSVRRGGNMIKKLLGAAAMAAVVFAVAGFRHENVGWRRQYGEDRMVSPCRRNAKWASFKEITAAQSACSRQNGSLLHASQQGRARGRCDEIIEMEPFATATSPQPRDFAAIVSRRLVSRRFGKLAGKVGNGFA